MIPSRSIARRLPVITGMGCVSPLGHDAATTRDSLRGGLDGVVPVTLFSVGSFQSKTAGQVPDAFLDLAVSIRPEAKAWPRAAKLILMAVHEALAARPGFRPDVVVVGTTSGGMDFGEQFFRGLKAGMSARGARRCVRGYLPHQPVFRALEHLGWDAPVRVISNACASGTNALAWAAGAIEAAYCIHAIHGEFLPPNINMRETDSGLDIVANHARHFAPRRVLSNSFGFGGANATIALEKYER